MAEQKEPEKKQNGSGGVEIQGKSERIKKVLDASRGFLT